MTPKTSWLAQFAAEGTVVMGSEDKTFWEKKPVKLVENLDGVGKCVTVVLAEVLQKVDDPEALIKQARDLADRVVITVPNEYSWDQKFQPMQNKQHKRFYDMILLTDLLDEAGLDYVIECVDYGGWSFFAVQAAPHLNSEERRKRKRAALQSGEATQKTAAESGVPTSDQSAPAPPDIERQKETTGVLTLKAVGSNPTPLTKETTS